MKKLRQRQTRLREQAGLKQKPEGLKYRRKYTTEVIARDLFLIRAKSIQRQMVRSMRRLACLYRGGPS